MSSIFYKKLPDIPSISGKPTVQEVIALILSYVRTILLYLVLIAVVRMMGKRQIGQMEPSEFVVTMLVANLAAIPMQDGGIPLFSGFVPIVTVLGVELVLSAGSMRSVLLRRILCGKPVILIENGRILPLYHEMFDGDAIFLQDVVSRACLRSKKSGTSVTFEYDGFKYIGLWHTPKTKANFVCVEPWTGRPDYDSENTELAEKEDMTLLAPNAENEHLFVMRFE